MVASSSDLVQKRALAVADKRDVMRSLSVVFFSVLVGACASIGDEARSEAVAGVTANCANERDFSGGTLVVDADGHGFRMGSEHLPCSARRTVMLFPNSAGERRLFGDSAPNWRLR